MRFQMKSLQRYAKTLLFLAVFTIAVMGFKCNGPIIPQIPGITVLATEDLTTVDPLLGTLHTFFPVPNAPDRGFQTSFAQDPNTGNMMAFTGKTNEFGVDTHPEAQTNANWQVCVGPTSSPPCFEGCITKNVPPQGAIFQLFCTV
jgi:hypothetical protein